VSSYLLVLGVLSKSGQVVDVGRNSYFNSYQGIRSVAKTRKQNLKQNVEINKYGASVFDVLTMIHNVRRGRSRHLEQRRPRM
jgi:hypothetical protein